MKARYPNEARAFLVCHSVSLLMPTNITIKMPKHGVETLLAKAKANGWAVSGEAWTHPDFPGSFTQAEALGGELGGMVPVRSALTAADLKVGRCYRAKRPGGVGFPALTNDRQIKFIGGDSVQYDGPSVATGRHYPTVKIDAFLRWAHCDVTDELPKGEWASW
jgi:hypothetical protein